MSWSSAKAMWEERFGSTSDYLYGTEPNDFLVAAVDGLPVGRVLCVAEGEGRNAVYLAGLGHEVEAVELTEAGVGKIRRLAEQRGVTVDVAQLDLAELEPAEASYDLVVSIFAHCEAATRVSLHRKLASALKPGGRLILEAYTPAQIGRGTGGPQEHALTMDLERLGEELEGLEFEHATELLRPVIEGPLHTGEGAVVQVVARRP